MLQKIFLKKKKDNRQCNSEGKNKVERQKLEKKVDKELKEGLKRFKRPHYNYWDLGTLQYREHLVNYLKKHIIYVYVLAKNADSDIDREIYANALCGNLCSFIDLYAQVLNIFYKLGLKPLRKNFSPTLFNPTTTIVDQALNGNLKKCNKKELTTSWGMVKKIIGKKYDEKNDYYKSTQTILDSDTDITAMKNLRNYSVHYQPLFSRFEIWSENNDIVVSVGSNSRASDQYQKFLDLAYRVIKKELLIIHYFEGMCFDQKMVPKNRKNEQVSIFKCSNCGSEVMISDYSKAFLKEKCKLKLFCERCKQSSIITDTGKTQIVHPEMFDRLLINEYKNMEIIDSTGRNIFQDGDSSDT